MRLTNQTRACARIASVVLLAPAAILGACATNWEGATRPDAGIGTALNPVGKQSGRLTVVALDSSDGRPLNKAIVDLVASADSKDPYHYRRTSNTNIYGTVVFNEVPPKVDVLIRHPRGIYALDAYPVPQAGGSSEFRVYIDTTSPRTANEDR